MSVVFPGLPAIATSPLPGSTVRSEQAQLIADAAGTMFRSECVPLAGETLFSERAVVGQLAEYAKNNLIEAPTYTAGHDDRAVSGTMRGHKRIGDMEITYEVRMLITKRSVVTLVVGGPSGGYPQPGLQEFLQSARLIQRQ